MTQSQVRWALFVFSLLTVSVVVAAIRFPAPPAASPALAVHLARTESPRRSEKRPEQTVAQQRNHRAADRPPADSPAQPSQEEAKPQLTSEAAVGKHTDSQAEAPAAQPAGGADHEESGIAPPAVDGGEQAGAEETGLSAEKRQSALAAYRQQVYSLISAHKRYPSIARRLRHEGRVALGFALDRAGNLMSVSVKSGSGYVELDEAALAAVRAVGQFPAFPAAVGSAKLDFEISLIFELE